MIKMKKAERKILEKRIIEVVNVLLEKYEPKPAKKVQKIVDDAAKSISKKVYKVTKDTTLAAKPKAKLPSRTAGSRKAKGK